MGINDFKTRLAAAKVGAGGEFVKADFHVHMPASSDYEYKNSDSYDKMASALTSSKTAIAVVLKHQEFPSPSEIEKLQQLCASTSLLPGAELNIFVDAMFKKVAKDHFFHAIVVADPHSDWGYLLSKAKEKLSVRGSGYPSGFDSSIRDVANFFLSEGCFSSRRIYINLSAAHFSQY